MKLRIKLPGQPATTHRLEVDNLATLAQAKQQVATLLNVADGGLELSLNQRVRGREASDVLFSWHAAVR